MTGTITLVRTRAIRTTTVANACGGWRTTASTEMIALTRRALRRGRSSLK
jgi:hypothetical protein